MKELIGFYLVSLAMSAFIVCVTGYGLSTKDKMIFLTQVAISLGLISIGTYLLVSD